MKQFTMPLYENSQRLITNLPEWYNFDVMLDTGAIFPVWVAEEETLIKLGASHIKNDIEFSGFGGKAKGNLYRLPYFKFGSLIYPNLPIVACEIAVPCQMIMSVTMFSRLRYEVDDENHMFNITIPDNQTAVRNLTIRDENGHIRVLCMSD